MDKGPHRDPGLETGSSYAGPTTGAAPGPRTSASGTSNSGTAPQTLTAMAQSIGVTTPGIGVTTPNIVVTPPSIGVTPSGIGTTPSATTPAIEATTQGVGATTPNMGTTTPDIGAPTPGIGATTPGIGATTPGTEAAATKVLEALTASAASATAQAKEDEEEGSSQLQAPSDQDKRKKNRQTTKLKSVLSNEPQRRQNVPHEEEFLRAVEAGDVPSVRRMLRNKPGLDVNCTDLLGRTPLRIAVQNENQEIVEILLDRAGVRNMYESLLLAISLDQESIAMCILRHPMYTKVEQQTRLYSNDSIFLCSNSEDSLFEAETTPLILAAQRNSYEVLSLLLDRGAKIEEPHDGSCDCSHCEANIRLDDLRNAKSRLNAYRGLTSEAYICLSSPDPILTAFNLRRKLKKVAQDEKHYRDEYEALQKKLGQYVVRLLDCVRGDEELDVLLNNGENGKYDVLGRLNLAIRYNEKKFVAHSSCQKKLSTMWYGEGLQYMNQSPAWARPIFVVVCGIAFPISSLVYFFAPTPKVRAFMRTPFVKFIHQSASFFVFLVLICCFSLTEKPSRLESVSNRVGQHIAHDEETKLNLTRAGIGWSEHYREYIPPTIFVVLNVFVIGMIWQECKQMYGAGPKDYFGSMFNLMDTFSLSLYVTSFVLRYVSYYKTYQAHMYLRSETGLKALVAREEIALHFHYWIYADRYYWDAFDPMVVAEGLFAVANVVSFSRLFYLLAANEQLGPLQISLRSMIGDISRFMAIFIIIFVAFMVGLNNLYWYYEPEVRGVVELSTHEPLVTEAEEAFGTIEKTFTTVFWSIFGMGESSVVRLGDSFSGDFTERVGYIVFGLYNVAIVIILMNMLIAMMSRSFEAIVDDQDIEWKFARAQLYMDFVQDGCTLPVPFNLIPSPKTLYRLAAALCSRCKKTQEPPQELNNVRHLQANGVDGTDFAINKNKLINADSVSLKSSTVCQSEGKDGASGSDSAVKKIQHLGKKLYKQKQEKAAAPTTSFATVMKRLVKRYIFESERVDNSPLEGDMDELKQDLSGLRFELNNLINQHQRKNSNMVHLLTTKLDFLISVVVSQGGDVPTESTAPPLRMKSGKSAIHNAVNMMKMDNHLHTRSKAKSRFSRFSPHRVSVADEGIQQDESVRSEGTPPERTTTQTQQATAKENHAHRARAFRNVKFDNQKDQIPPNRMAPRSQRNDTSNGPGVKHQLDVGKGNLRIPDSSGLQRSGSYGEVDVDSMKVTVIQEESGSETDHSNQSGSYLEESDHLEEEEDDSSMYTSSGDHHRGRPHQFTSYRRPSYSATYSVRRAGVHQSPHQSRSTPRSVSPDWHDTPGGQYTTHIKQNSGDVPGQDRDYGSDEEEEEEEIDDFVDGEEGHVPNEGRRGTYNRSRSHTQWMERGEHEDSLVDSSDMSLNASIDGQHQGHHRRLYNAAAPRGRQGRYHQSYVNEAYEDCTEGGSDQDDGTLGGDQQNVHFANMGLYGLEFSFPIQ